MIDIKFNVPPYVDKAADYIQECVKNQKICGDGEYTKKCNAWIDDRTGTGKERSLIVKAGIFLYPPGTTVPKGCYKR